MLGCPNTTETRGALASHCRRPCGQGHVPDLARLGQHQSASGIPTQHAWNCWPSAIGKRAWFLQCNYSLKDHRTCGSWAIDFHLFGRHCVHTLNIPPNHPTFCSSLSRKSSNQSEPAVRYSIFNTVACVDPISNPSSSCCLADTPTRTSSVIRAIAAMKENYYIHP